MNVSAKDGTFIDATRSVKTTVTPSGESPFVLSETSNNISEKEAIKGIGTDKVIKGIEAAVPSFAAQFGRVTAQDARAHPGKYVFAAGEVGLIFTPLPEAYAGIEGIHEVKAAFDAAVAGGDITWELEGLLTGK